MIEVANVFVAIAAFLAGFALLICHGLTGRWRQAVSRDAPPAIAGPMSIMSHGVSFLPFVFMAGAAARLSVLCGNAGLTAFLTGLTGVLTLYSAWRFARAAVRLRRLLGGSRGIR